MIYCNDDVVGFINSVSLVNSVGDKTAVTKATAVCLGNSGVTMHSDREEVMFL